MTLSVDAFWTDSEGIEHTLPLKSSLAGVESTRRTFYGSPQAIAKGLRLLPRLLEQATLQVDADSFEMFLGEIEVLEELARESDTYESYWRFRLDNLRAAVAAARAHGSAGKVELG
jgi:hypothetical protein